MGKGQEDGGEEEDGEREGNALLPCSSWCRERVPLSPHLFLGSDLGDDSTPLSALG